MTKKLSYSSGRKPAWHTSSKQWLLGSTVLQYQKLWHIIFWMGQTLHNYMCLTIGIAASGAWHSLSFRWSKVNIFFGSFVHHTTRKFSSTLLITSTYHGSGFRNHAWQLQSCDDFCTQHLPFEDFSCLEYYNVILVRCSFG